ncbi:hypothetical protein [Kitasatospora sp. CMC57]|uniref:hypothetical protein n=1 Tax=Kitasatospora sp. CMC57 TaxID=3231513 RepID=UPI0038B6932E
MSISLSSSPKKPIELCAIRAKSTGSPDSTQARAASVAVQVVDDVRWSRPSAFNVSFAVRPVLALRALGKESWTSWAKSASVMEGIAASVSVLSASSMPPSAVTPGT